MSEAALITGASSGLGMEYAKLFAADKKDLILVARRRDRLDALSRELSGNFGIQARVVAADLADIAAPKRIETEVKRLGAQIGFLVNNAGFGVTGRVAELDPERELAVVQVNIAALLALTRAFLPAMIANRRGRILNIGSTAGFQPGPFMAVYYASKAFVNSFTEALWYELKGTGVSATVSCPGATATEFAAVAGNDRSRLFKLGAMDATRVAREGYRAMLAGKPMAIHGIKNKVLAASVRFSPRATVRAISAAMNRQPAQRQTVAING